MYPENCTLVVEPPELARGLEGEFRPSHFGGVCTVVFKLFQLIPADVAFFGEKDFQQLAVVRQMVADCKIATRVEGCPIIREPDGLAMSSRNIYLAESEREIALSLNRALSSIAEAVDRILDALGENVSMFIGLLPTKLGTLEEYCLCGPVGRSVGNSAGHLATIS